MLSSHGGGVQKYNYNKYFLFYPATVQSELLYSLHSKSLMSCTDMHAICHNTDMLPTHEGIITKVMSGQINLIDVTLKSYSICTFDSLF